MKSCPFSKLLIVSWHTFFSDLRFTVGARWVCKEWRLAHIRTHRLTYIKLIFCIIRNYNPFFSWRVLSYTECTQKAAVTVKLDQKFRTAFCNEYKYLHTLLVANICCSSDMRASTMSWCYVIFQQRMEYSCFRWKGTVSYIFFLSLMSNKTEQSVRYDIFTI
jgi:hypothetical protein